MPRPTTITLAYATGDPNGICASQTATSTGGSNLTIAGALATGGVATLDAARHVSITSTGNNSTKTFTITGTDRYSNAITESLSGPTGGAVYTTKNFATVTNVAIDAASAGAVIVGSGDQGESQWIPLDRYSTQRSVSVDLSTGANFTFDIQHTNDNVQAEGFQETSATAYADPTIASKSADQFLGNMVLSRAIRLKVTSHVAGSATLTLVQGGE